MVVSLGVVLLAGLARWFAVSQTRYGGSTLSEWLRVLNANDPVELARNVDRFRAAAPSMVDPLLRIVRTHPPLMVRMIEPAVSRLPAMIAAPIPNVTWYQVRRYQALRALSFVGPLAAQGVPTLIAALEENEYAMGGGARMALTSVGAAAVPELGRLLRRAPEAVAAQAAQALSEMGREAAGAIPDLEFLISKGNVVGGLMAAHALAQIGAPARDALERCLTNATSAVRVEALDGLCSLDPTAPKVQEALEAALRDEDRLVRERAEQIDRRLSRK